MRVPTTAVLLFLLVAAAVAQLGSARSNSGPPSKADKIATGQYIVNHVAMCGSCHTPHSPTGEPIQERALMGGHLHVKIPAHGRWTNDAPQIAGLPRWEDEEIVILLSTGKLETGLTMRKPMPQFHMKRSDAEAVVAYLRSLSVPSKHRHPRLHPFAIAAARH